MASEDNGWQLITLSEFACPAPPASSRLRQGLRRLGRVLGWRQEADGGEHTEVPDFEGFDRDPALEALSAFCQDWPQARPEVRFLLDPPFSGSAAIARDWAERRGWPVLQPPTKPNCWRSGWTTGGRARACTVPGCWTIWPVIFCVPRMAWCSYAPCWCGCCRVSLARA
ncbi:hypothetical protein MBH78_15035 [Oceanimonas sp. NS1]|nr:hypothetical protein [Oceanimonas sp. NS1]